MKVSASRKHSSSSLFAPWCLLLFLLPSLALSATASSSKTVSSTCTTTLLGVTLGSSGKLTLDELDAFEVAWKNKFNDIWMWLPHDYQVTGINVLSETVTPVRRRLSSVGVEEGTEEEEENGGIESRRSLQNSQGDDDVETTTDGTCTDCSGGDLPDDGNRRRMLRSSHDPHPTPAEREMYLLYVAQPSSNYDGWAQLTEDLTKALKQTGETAYSTLEGVRIHCSSMTNEFQYVSSTGTITQAVYSA